MTILSIEHGKAAYWADLWAYGIAVLLLAFFLLRQLPVAHYGPGAALVAAGLIFWSLAEYLLHRFVLHGLQPFRRWHEEHHRRPRALISAPLLVSGSLVAGLDVLPALLIGVWQGLALALGFTLGYLGYALLHHGLHQGGARAGWMRQRRRWHALHHGSAAAVCYGVSTTFWDHVFGTRPAQGVAPGVKEPDAARPGSRG